MFSVTLRFSRDRSVCSSVLAAALRRNGGRSKPQGLLDLGRGVAPSAGVQQREGGRDRRRAEHHVGVVAGPDDARQQVEREVRGATDQARHVRVRRRSLRATARLEDADGERRPGRGARRRRGGGRRCGGGRRRGRGGRGRGGRRGRREAAAWVRPTASGPGVATGLGVGPCDEATHEAAAADQQHDEEHEGGAHPGHHEDPFRTGACTSGAPTAQATPAPVCARSPIRTIPVRPLRPARPPPRSASAPGPASGTSSGSCARSIA